MFKETPLYNIDLKIFAVLVFLVMFHFVISAYGQTQVQSTKAIEMCGQSAEVSGPLTEEAERGQLNVRRVEFVGNTYTRGRDLFRRTTTVNEGDIFTRKNLQTAIARLSRMSTIYPVTTGDIEIRLDRVDKIIDIIFCIKQKPK